MSQTPLLSDLEPDDILTQTLVDEPNVLTSVSAKCPLTGHRRVFDFGPGQLDVDRMADTGEMSPKAEFRLHLRVARLFLFEHLMKNAFASYQRAAECLA